MKPPPFRYLSPTSVEEAASVLADCGGDAKILAGGQSLMPMLNFRLSRPTTLVDINRISPLEFVKLDDGRLRIGALTRQAELEDSELVRGAAPLIFQTMRWVGHRATRNRGTLGGTVAHADPAAELPAVLIALSAEVIAYSQARGERVVPVENLFIAPLMTSLEPDEILIEVRVPVQGVEVRSGIDEIARRKGDFALAGIAAAVVLDSHGRFSSARLTAFGVSPVPVRLRGAEELLLGREPEHDILQAVAEQARLEIDPWNDLQASADYRCAIAGVLVQRVLNATLSDEQGGERSRG
jgi:CO/xanthine dehydrogenase FAD-binding subunit